MTDVIYDGFSGSGLRSRLHYDDVDGLMHVEHIGDNEPIHERNKAVYNGHGGWASDRTGETKDGSMRHVAAISPMVQVDLLNKGINILKLDDPEQSRKLNRVLNSNEYWFLRTTPGKI